LTTKTITVTEEAYNVLSRHKRKEESFSELAIRLTSSHGKLKDCWGLWKLSEKDMDVFDAIKRAWTESDDEMRRKLVGR